MRTGQEKQAPLLAVLTRNAVSATWNWGALRGTSGSPLLKRSCSPRVTGRGGAPALFTVSAGRKLPHKEQGWNRRGEQTVV